MSRTRNLSDLLDSNGDVVSGALDNVPAADVVNDTTPQLGGDLASNGNDILFADNDKAIFGAGSDLQIHHDGSNSFINDTGTGNLIVRGVNVTIQDSTTKQYFSTNESTGVATLFHNSNAKLATTSTGVSITGDLSVSGSISGAGKVLQVVNALTTASSSQSFTGTTWGTVNNISATITPSSTSSKIIMMARLGFEWGAGDIYNLNFAPARNGTRFNISSASFSSGSNNTIGRAMGGATTAIYQDQNTTPDTVMFTTIDSPSTTSATTYTIQLICTNNGGTAYYNRTISTTNLNSAGMSTEIILMEIGA